MGEEPELMSEDAIENLRRTSKRTLKAGKRSNKALDRLERLSIAPAQRVSGDGFREQRIEQITKSAFHSAVAARYDLGMALSAVLAEHHLSSLPLPLLSNCNNAAYLTRNAIERSGHPWRVNVESELPISVINAFVRAYDAHYYSNAARELPGASRIIKTILAHSKFESRSERDDARLEVVAQRARNRPTYEIETTEIMEQNIDIALASAEDGLSVMRAQNDWPMRSSSRRNRGKLPRADLPEKKGFFRRHFGRGP
jgi:hypothetical protein